MDHSFDVDVAIKYGVNAAILLQNLYWWIQKNRANKRNFHDGTYWTYNTREAYTKLFPYMSERQVKTAMDKLIEDGIVITGDYNIDRYKRPTWYAITKKGFTLLQKRSYVDTEMSERESENVSTYTDISTDNKPNLQQQLQHGVAVVDTVQAYASSNLQHMSPGNIQDMLGFLEDLPEDLIRFAIDEACGNGAPRWAYVSSILSSFIRNGIKTVGDAKAAKAAREAKKNTDPEPTPGPYHDGLTDEERQRKIEEMNEAERRKEWGEDWFERYTKK